MTELYGEITEIIYKNETTGYTICNILTEDEEYITIVGFMPYIQDGEEIKVIGNYVNHPDYGKQFKVETFEKFLPKGKNAIEKYLASGIIKGLGPATARKIVNKFGEESIEIIRNLPEKLVEVKGINYEKALNMSQKLNEQWDLWKLTSFLGNYGIGNKNCMKLYKVFGTTAVDTLKENPYIILEICSGVEFKSVDRIAQDVGYDLNSDIRAGAGIKYMLGVATTDGHTYLPRDILIESLTQFLGVEEDVIVSGIAKLAIEGKIFVYEQEKIYLSALYNAERNIAMKLLKMSEINNKYKIKKIVEKLEDNLVLTDEQKRCIEEIFNSQVAVITGGPGTGKTTIVKGILKTLETFEAKVVLCAPTGRAAKRLSEAAGIEAKTIHRLLEIKHIDDEDRNALYDISVTPIEADVVIVDEISMIDALLMNNLLKAIEPTTMIVLVGDADQLPSVGAGNILRDIIDSNKIPVFALTKIFRQAEKSRIVVNAHKINEGEMPIFNEVDTDSFLVNASTYKDIENKLIELCTSRLPNFKNCVAVDDIQVITPMRKGNLGANALNKALQQALNPYASYKKQLEFGGRTFRVNDKVMQIKNNYDIEWTNEDEEGVGVFNGDMGRITAIDEEWEMVRVLFDDGKEVEYDSVQLEELDLAYATTVHKSQGSEFRIVVIPVFMGSQRLMTRNLLYTAMTRAKEMLVFVGNMKCIEYMAKNLNKKERFSGLKQMLEQNEKISF